MNYFEYIEDYCEGLLDESTSQAFEKAMSEDNKLERAVSLYQEGKKISEGLLEIDIMETIDNLKVEMIVENPVSDIETTTDINIPKIQKETRKFDIRKWLMAASFIGVLVASGWWMMRDGGRTNDLWEKSYMRPYDEDATKSVDTIGMDLFAKGKYFFALNDFDQSENNLTQFIKTNSSTDSLSKGNYWLGHVYMNKEQWDKAIMTLQQSNEEGVEENVDLCKKMKN